MKEGFSFLHINLSMAKPNEEKSKCGFVHSSSSFYSYSNGMEGNAIKIVITSKKNKQQKHISHSVDRSTPVSGFMTGPAQAMVNCQSWKTLQWK